jgi:hypothetical protein
VKTSSDYRRLADECRTVATTLPDGTKRQQLLIAAETWEQLAAERDKASGVHLDEVPKEPPKD